MNSSVHSGKSVLHRPISFICFHLKSLCRPIGPSALPNFSHLFILWSCLLWLVGGWLGLGVLWSVLGDAVKQEYTNQDTTYEHYYHSSWNCNPHSGTSWEGPYRSYVKGRGIATLEYWIHPYKFTFYVKKQIFAISTKPGIEESWLIKFTSSRQLVAIHVTWFSN